MHWGRKEIDKVAVESATTDYEAFEAIGLEAIENAAILDMGCFDGFNTVLKFAPYDNISKVVGIDPEEEALGLAIQRTNDPRFSWAQASAESYNAANSSFDVVYLSHVFQHVEIQQAYYNATAAQEKYIASGKSVKASEEAFHYAEDKYNAGKSTVFEFNEAKTKYAKSLVEEAQAKFSFILRAKILDFYNGTPIKL